MCQIVCVSVMESKTLNTGSCGIIFWLWVQAWTEEDLHRSGWCSHHDRCIAAASTPHFVQRRTTLPQHCSIAAASLLHHSVLHRRATAAPLVPCRTAALHRRSAPHRRSTAAWCNTADRFRIHAASLQHHRTAAPQHRSIAAASLPHHFRSRICTASPRRTTVWPHR